MKLRWKLLLLILIVGLLPMLITRSRVQKQVGNMSRELSGEMRSVLLSRSRAELLQSVRSHAAAAQLAGGLLKLVVRVQATELEKRLAAGKSVNATPIPVTAPVWEEDIRCRLRGDGTCRPIQTALNAVSVRDPSGDSLDEADVLRSMLPVYQGLTRDFSELMTWQMTVFNSGVAGVYPAVDHFPMMFQPQRTEWFQRAEKSDVPVWALPGPDPITRRMALSLSMAFRSPDGRVAGVTGIMIPMNSVLNDRNGLAGLSDGLESLLIYLDPERAGSDEGVLILARENADVEHKHYWHHTASPEFLPMDDPEGMAAMAAELKAGKSGIRSMPYEGRDCLWAYAPLGEDVMTAALLIAPTAEVSEPADTVESYIQGRFQDQLERSLSFILLTLIVMLAVAWLLSMVVTRNIGILVDSVRRVAEGDFTARADFVSRDEMGELAKAFNRMVPALEYRFNMQRTLDMAKEVQNNLLPGQDPVVKGMDVAGSSVYCDDTGGDYFDYFARTVFDKGRVGVLVGDVTGHGVPAALMMASARAYLRLRVYSRADLAQAMADVNNRLFMDSGHSGRFMTLFCGLIDAVEGSVRWVRAGHDPALLYDPAAGTFTELMGNGLPLGTIADDTYEENLADIRPGQILAVGTDGIWEAVNPEGEMFGKDRFKDILRAESEKSAREIVDSVLAAVEEFRGSLRRRDDVTLVVLKITSEQ